MSRRRMKNLSKVISTEINGISVKVDADNEKIISELNSEITILKNSLDAKKAQNKIFVDKLKNKEDQLQKLLNQKNEYEELVRNLILNVDNTVEHIYALNVNNLQLNNVATEYKVKSENLLQKYNEVKKHLSYRIGSYIIENTRQPFNILKHSKEVVKIYKDYLVDSAKSNQPFLFKKNDETLSVFRQNDKSIFYYKNSILALRKNNSNIFFENLNEVLELYFNVVLAVPNAKIEIEAEVEVINGDLILSYEDKGNIINKKIIKGDKIKRNIKLENSKIYSLFKVLRASEDCKLLLKVKKLVGVPGLIVLNHDINGFNGGEFSFNISDKNVVNEGLEKLSYNLPPNFKKNVLWNANEIALNYNYKCALDYISKYAADYQKNATFILEANANYKNEKLWIESINNYLKGYGLAEIELENNKLPRFYRIVCNKELIRVNGNKKVTIIMPAYNAEKTIIKAINSILEQTWTNIELIVIDDFSSDRTWEIIQSISDPRLIKLKNKINLGAYVSKNLALKYATGDYVTGHDADDWAHPQRIEKHIMKVLSTNGKVKASITKMLRLDENGFFNFFAKEGLFCEDGVTRIASITCLFETNFLKNELGGWDSARFGADSEIIARAKIALGEEGFQNYNELAMICLDAEGSLTNDVINGVSKIHGISPSRKEYKSYWQAWHKTLDSKNIFLPFPHEIRFFNIPEANKVDINSLKELMI